MPPSKTPPLPLPDFERISQAILGILVAEKGDITASCLFFGIIGESILKRHYKLNAKAVMGSASFNFNGSKGIAFATQSGKHTEPGEEHFHCWVEVNGWFLDFSSIVFPEISASFGAPSCPRLMFQKPIARSSPSISEIHAQGTFYCLNDEVLSRKKHAGFRAIPAYVDLIEICTDWYKKPPKTMHPIGLGDQYGNSKPAFISKLKFSGVWQ